MLVCLTSAPIAVKINQDKIYGTGGLEIVGKNFTVGTYGGFFGA